MANLLFPARDVLDGLRDGPWLDADRMKIYPRLLLAGYVIAAIFYLAFSEGLIDSNGKPVGTDFVNVYAAGDMALAEDAAGAYDWAKHSESERALFPGRSIPYFGWHYPPLFFLIAAPLAFLPYALALGFYQVATLAAYAALMWRMLRPNRDALLIALAFPAVFVCLFHGQNGFLTAALLGGGLLLLDRRPWLAGALLGALAYKPQFVALPLLIPLVTLRWRVVVSATATIATFSVVTLVLFGPEVWSAFFASETLTRTIVLEQGSAGWHKIQSVFAGVRLLGGSIALAYAVQFAVALASIAATVWVWRSKTPYYVQCAVLCLAIPLVTPYLLDYDLVFLALPIAWLALEGRVSGFCPWEKSVLFLLWLMPLVARGVADLLHVPIGPLVIGLAFAFALARARTSLAARAAS
ncbi:MAG: glycosyltransferase family 87 protein [Alphaproteobacteria bacterium]